jgi:Calcineurin-like phosphoesterase
MKGSASTRLLTALLALAIASVHCAVDTTPVDAVEEDLRVPARNWNAYPAIVEIDNAAEVYAVSDPHGAYEQFSSLLAGNKLIDAPDPNPSKPRWTGGRAVLVIAGDLINKGPDSLKVIDFVRSVAADAQRKGGRVVAVMGNHEAEFLLNPSNAKAMSIGVDANGIDNELSAANIAPKTLAKGTDKEGRGRWLANLPFGVRIETWFFAHGGNTQELSLNILAKKLQSSVDRNGYGDKDITGSNSILQAQGWYGRYSDANAGSAEARALGVSHIAFGHDPGAFGERGSVRASNNKVLFKLDTAMGRHEGGKVNKGYLLHITFKASETAEALDENGNGTQIL